MDHVALAALFLSLIFLFIIVGGGWREGEGEGEGKGREETILIFDNRRKGSDSKLVAMVRGKVEKLRACAEG